MMTRHTRPDVGHISPAAQADQDRLLTVAEVRQRLSLCHATIYKLIAAGDLPSLKIGRNRRIRARDLTAFIDRRAAA